MTTDKFLKILSIMIFAGFIILSVTKVFVELSKPKEPLEKALAENCVKTVALGNKEIRFAENKVVKLEKEDDFLSQSEYDCVFIDKSLQNSNDFFKSAFAHGFLKKSDYLFIGERGVVVKKNELNYHNYSELLRNCIRENKCDGGSDGERIVNLTLGLINSTGEPVVTATFSDEKFSEVLKKSPKLLGEMAKSKNLDINSLKFTIVFHKNYAYIDSKDLNFIDSITKPASDGLFISARGAKLRLLPFEYSKKGISYLIKKSIAYGLEKDDYKKDFSSIYIFNTARFVEKDNKMAELFGTSLALKADYPYPKTETLVQSFLLKRGRTDGFFNEELQISTGKFLEKAKTTKKQIAILDALILISAKSSDEKQKAMVAKLIESIGEKIHEADESEQILFVAALHNFAFYNKDFSISKYSWLEDKWSRWIKEKPQGKTPYFYAALTYSLIKSFETTGNEADKAAALQTLNMILMESLDIKEKIYLFSLVSGALFYAAGDSFADKMALDFSLLIRSVIYSNSDYPDYIGSIFRNRKPDTISTLYAAIGVSEYSKLKKEENLFSGLIPLFARYVSFAAVTDDDVIKFADSKAAERMRGGLRNGVETDIAMSDANALAVIFFNNLNK